MTAASSPPPRDEEVCTCKPWRGPGFHLDGCPRRPAAPSEPPAADSPTPGTPELDLSDYCANRDFHEGCGECDCACHGHAAPSPVDTTEPPADREPLPDDGPDYHAEHFAWVSRQPPAKTQQDDELAVADRLWRLYTHFGPNWKMPDTVDGFRKDARYVLAALTARPSADTETLRERVVALARELCRDADTYTEEAEYDTQRGNHDAHVQHVVASAAYADAADRLRAALDGDTKTLRQVKLAPEPCWLPRCAGTDGSCGHSEFGS